ncbi:hypothetical protein Tco_0655472 [Tanacetum coccineum]|uniref:Uncharacterized protein n=1 Tax=Tanacetum coccineum TaxID=301880 RepID=A0ABQ4X638_9ASTR
MEYLVNISKRRAFWSLNEDILKIYYSDYQYAVSIKEDTAYPCMHSPKTTKERRSIRRIQKKSIRRIEDIVCEYSGRYQAWSLLQETTIRRIQSLRYALDNGIWKEPEPVKHNCKPFNYKTRCSEWPTYSWREDGYGNGGNFPGAYHIGNSLHYQDLEWNEALEDSELKDEALRNKVIMEGLISDDESCIDCWKRWKSHEIYYHNYDEEECENKTHEEGHELCSIKTRKVPVCQIKRYKKIKYSFKDEEEYVAIKADEYDDLTITSEEACRAYQEIFRMMDEGWMVTRTETLEAKNIDEYWWRIYKSGRS